MLSEIFLLIPSQVISCDLRRRNLAVVNFQALSRYLEKLHHRNQQRQQNPGALHQNVSKLVQFREFSKAGAQAVHRASIKIV